MSERGFEFRTKSGSSYYYHDSNGCVTVLEDIAEGKGRDDRAKSSGTPLSASAEAWRGFEADDKDRDVREINRTLETEGCRQLTLIVSEDCNLRCRYCIYSAGLWRKLL